MNSTLYHEELASTDRPERRSDGFRPKLRDQMGEMAVFVLVAVAVFYIATASCWFLL
jgi:hypothetical protein